MTAPTGSLADEADQLLDVLAQRLIQLRDRRAASTDRAEDAGENAGDDASGHADGSAAASQDPAAGAAEPEDAPAGQADTAGEYAAGEYAAGEYAAGEYAAGDAADAAGPCPHCGHDPSAPSTCTGCPLCAALALLRGERPETTAKLADSALTIVQLLRGLLAAGGDDHGATAAASKVGSPTNGDNPSGDGDLAAAAPRDSLVRIEVR